MSIGPVEYIIMEFSGTKFEARVVPALKNLLERELVQIIDLVFVKKDAQGDVSTYELTALDGDAITSFDELDGEVSELLSEDDIRAAAAGLAPNTSAVMLVWENVWARQFAEAVRGAGGRVVINERVPAATFEAVRTALAGDS